jgi:hypothetical protein
MKMKFRYIFLASIITFCALFNPVKTTAQQLSSPPIIISEIGWAGSSTSLSDEWLELENTSDQPVNLEDWQIQITGGTSTNTITLTSTIPVGGVFLYSRYSAGHPTTTVKTALSQTPAPIKSITKSLSLPNDNLGLILFDNNQNVIDQLVNDGDFAGTSTPKASQVRKMPVTDGKLKESWYTANYSAGFIEGVSDFGTPGLINTSRPNLNDVNCSPSSFINGQDIDISCSGVVDSFDSQPITLIVRDSEGDNPIQIIDGKFSFQKKYSSPNEKISLSFLAKNGDLVTTKDIVISGYDSSQNIHINEIYPNPNPGDSEWIELKSEDARAINLSGWSLDDEVLAGTKPYYFPADTIINPNEIKTFNSIETKIGLNNTDDTVNLIDPQGIIVDTISYANAPVGQTYSRLTERSFVWNTISSPDLENKFPPPIYYSDNISLSEIMPNPQGSDLEDEWVEIYNSSPEPVDLSGWQIDDIIGGSKPFLIPSGTKIQGESYMVFSRAQTNIALNNSSDSVRLIQPDEKVLQQVDYGKASIGESYAMIDGQWQWTNQPTNGLSNLASVIISKPAKKPRTKKVSVTKNKKKEPPVKAVINQDSQTGTIVLASSNKVYPDIVFPDLGHVAGVSTKRRASYLIILDIFAIIIFSILFIINIWLNTKPSINLKKLLDNFHLP